MRAGDLRHRITVQAQAETDDGRGGQTLGAWSTVTGMGRIPAKVTPLDGSEQIQAMQVQSGVSHEVRVRYRTGIKAKHRALWHARGGDRTLYLVGAPVIEGDHEALRFLCREDTD